MSRRSLLNLALLAVAGSLAALIALRPGLEQPATLATLTAIDPQTVAHIELTRLAGETLRFSKTGAHWDVVGATTLPADDFQVHTILALLQAGVVRSYPADSLKQAQIGLDPPQASVSCDDTRLELGATEAIDGLRYVRLGDTVYLVADRYAHLLNAGMSNFLQRQLLPDDAQLSELHLPGLTLTREDGVHWQLQPDTPGASADDINMLLGNWQRASALYVTRADADADADANREKITVRLRDHGKALEFTIVARTPDLVLARPDWGMQYHLSADMGAQLLALPDSTTPE